MGDTMKAFLGGLFLGVILMGAFGCHQPRTHPMTYTASEMREMAAEWEAEAKNTAAECDGPDDPLKAVIDTTVKRATDTAQMLRQAADAMERPVKFELTANGGGGWGDKGHTGAVYKGSDGQLIPTPNAGGMQDKG